VCAALSVCQSSALAQKHLALAELGKRNAADQTPVYGGQKAVVRGVASMPAFHFPEYALLAIQDDSSGGILKLALPETFLDNLKPGDEVEGEGRVGTQFGMAVLQLDTIMILGHKAVPAPADFSIKDLEGFGNLGRLARVEGTVRETGYNSGGALVLLKGTREVYRIFFPQGRGQAKVNVDSFRSGDTVRVTGVALQYCAQPPYNSGWELMVADIHDIAAVQHSTTLKAPVIGGGVAVVLLAGLAMWARERRLRNQRKKLRSTYKLGEEILSASSTEAILTRISETLPTILGVTRVQLYIFNRAGKTLDAISESGEGASISLSSPPGGTPAGAVACFHYRTLLVIPDIDRSPFPIAGAAGERTPKSLLFVPMMAQGEVTGVLELDQDDKVRDFSADVQALAQHLGNQIGVAIRLLDQRSVQEQLFRTEKTAAIGRLISGVVNELQTPLAHIKDLAQKALDKAHGGAAEREVTAIASEAAKASSMVSRLVSFAAAEQVEAKAVDVSRLLHNLIEFREGDWKASGIRVRNLISREPMPVLGAHGQLEQVFLNLLIHAEQSLAQAEQKTITVRSSLIAKRVLVEISFSSPSELRKPEDAAAVLGVTRGVASAHGGEVRLIEKNNTDPRFEVELPASVRERSAPAAAASAPAPAYTAPRDGRRMTALVIEHDDAAQRQITALLSTRGFRVVPVANSDAGLEMAQRMRFDAAFCSLHAPGLNWVELSERMHSRVGGFILLSDGYDGELSADFEGDRRFVLPKPIQEDELDRVLRLIAPRPATVIPIKSGIA
jgi:GAF domain-containing protein/CheY-like chemotaxis protein